MARVMDGMYENIYGKKRVVGPEAPVESQKRREAFAQLEQVLKPVLVELGIHDVVFELTGSVLADASQVSSDIDVVVRSYTAPGLEERIVMARIRTAVRDLVKQHSIPYTITISTLGENLGNALRFKAQVTDALRQ